MICRVRVTITTKDKMREKKVVTKVTCRTGRHDDAPSGGVTTTEAHREGVASVEVTEGDSEAVSEVDTVVVMGKSFYYLHKH